MSSTPQGTEPSFATLDRRLRARRSVPSLAYIDLAENNGGIIVNLSEGGLAVTAAAPLNTERPARMRFQLPGSRDRLAACGEITWISESRKEAGLRFVDLSEDVRDRIAAWVSSKQLPATRTRAVSAGRSRSAGPLPILSGKNAIAASVGTNEAAHEKSSEPERRHGDDRHAQGVEKPLPSHTSSPEQAVSVERPVKPSDRRGQVRRRVTSLSYIDLGNNNGGIILNLSEGGLAMASAGSLFPDGPAQIQFQLPGSDDCLKVGAQVAWISKSRKQAGLHFIDLPEDTRARITSWLSNRLSSITSGSEEPGSREKFWRRLELPIIPMTVPSADQDRTSAAQTLMPARNLVPTLLETTALAPSSSGLGSLRSGATTGHGLGIAAENLQKKALLKRTGATLTLIMVLGALASLLAGWFMRAPNSLTRILARFGKATPNTTETANDVEAPATGTVASVPNSSMRNATPTVRPTYPPGDTSPIGALAHTVRKPPPPRHRGNVLASPFQGAKQPGPQSAATTTPPSPIVSQVHGTTAGQESPPPAKPTETPEVVKPSFAVNFNPYPSIRVPAGFKSPPGARMEIGRLLSRVDPVYPEGAEKQRVEGTVKLHIIIGLDGSVRSVEPISGPALLIPAANDAVRQWRYTETSIGEQLVETEEDITVTFRLMTQATGPN